MGPETPWAGSQPMGIVAGQGPGHQRSCPGAAGRGLGVDLPHPSPATLCGVPDSTGRGRDTRAMGPQCTRRPWLESSTHSGNAPLAGTLIVFIPSSGTTEGDGPLQGLRASNTQFHTHTQTDPGGAQGQQQSNQGDLTG